MDDFRYSIRSPATAEKRACRMLLPGATGVGQRSRLFVAVSGTPERVIAAAALGVDLLRQGRRWLVDLHVIPPCRGHGVARTLLDAVLGECRAREIPQLSAWGWIDPQSPAAQVWRRLGFTVSQTRREYEVGLVEGLKILTPLLERVRDRIPASARIMPLRDADLVAVAGMHEQYLGGNRHILWPRLNGTADDRYDAALSSVLMLDDRVVGILLGRTFVDGSCEVDAKVIHPELRRRWANLWLTHEGMRRVVQSGFHTMRFLTLDEHDDTRQLSERLGGRLTGCAVRLTRNVAPANPVSAVVG